MSESKWWAPWALVASFSTFCALVHAVALIIGINYVEAKTEWTPDLVLAQFLRGFVDWYLWGALSIPIFFMVRGLLASSLRGLALFAVHMVAGSTFIAIWGLLNCAITSYWHWTEAGREIPYGEIYGEFLIAFVGHLTTMFAVYIGIVAACYAFLYYRPALKASQLESRLTRAKLQALQMQLHPHFLFNALNSISVLVHRDPDLADRMISRLSELLRLTLSSGDRQKVPLREELEILDKYMEIELIRFQNRLRIEKDIAPDVLGASVPAMILQPLVENSIQHGIARRKAAGWIGISGWREDDQLILEVSDDGPGVQGSPEKLFGRGVGLTNGRDRLEQLYGADQSSFEIESRSKIGAPTDETGMTIRIRIPYQENLDDSQLGSIHSDPRISGRTARVAEARRRESDGRPAEAAVRRPRSV
ncbi:MAG: histidine kinase [Planctomycetota bacterium]